MENDIYLDGNQRENAPNPFRITEDKQAAKLPITRSSKGLDTTRVILGLKNFGFFWVVGIALAVLIPTDNMPAGALAASVTWVIIKRYIDQKPRGYLLDMIQNKLIWEKKFTHRPHVRVKFEETKKYFGHLPEA